MKVFIYKIGNGPAVFKGMMSNTTFSQYDDLAADNETLYATIEVSSDEYMFMVEYWDDCVDCGITPEIYLPSGMSSLIKNAA